MSTNMVHKIDEARDRTAHAMRTAGKKLRSGSRTTARAIQRSGSRGADMLEASERVVRTERGSGAGRKLVLFAVIALAAGVLAAVLLSRNSGAELDEPGYVL
jgi:hypothetical protein